MPVHCTVGSLPSPRIIHLGKAQSDACGQKHPNGNGMELLCRGYPAGESNYKLPKLQPSLRYAATPAYPPMCLDHKRVGEEGGLELTIFVVELRLIFGVSKSDHRGMRSAHLHSEGKAEFKTGFALNGIFSLQLLQK